jgi:hypothetical protein
MPKAKPYELWAWLTFEEGAWGIVAGMMPGIPTVMPLMHRDRDIAERFKPLADAHAKKSGNPVRLAHLLEAQL